MYLLPTKTYFVYIMSNRSKTLYTGVTNSLMRRVAGELHRSLRQAQGKLFASPRMTSG